MCIVIGRKEINYEEVFCLYSLRCHDFFLNVSDKPLKFAIRRQYSGDIQDVVNPHSSKSLRVSANPGEIVCMCFTAPSNFNGRVQCGC